MEIYIIFPLFSVSSDNKLPQAGELPDALTDDIKFTIPACPPQYPMTSIVRDTLLEVIRDRKVISRYVFWGRPGKAIHAQT
jgi:hypothetical protein